MKKSLFLLFALSLFLMSFQCDDEIEGTIVQNNFKATVSDANLTLNDTLWINGRLSSQAFDEAVGDSIPYPFSNGDFFSVFRMNYPEAEPSRYQNNVS